MSTTPKKTRYASSSETAVELAWVLKRITETHDRGQQRIMEEARKQSEALTANLQAEQYEVFRKLTEELGLSEADYGDGRDWTLNIADLDQNSVAMVHRSETEALRGSDNCDCPVCTMRRLMTGELDEDEAEGDKTPQVLH